jgi:DNA-binding response OmpR family regulator
VDARMLVVTADDRLVELLRPQVENQGCECHVAGSYDEASAQLPWADALILDLELPGGGLDALRRIRIEVPDARIIVVATSPADAEAAALGGVDGTLLEPFSIAEVIEMIRSVRVQRAEVIDLRAVAEDDVVPLHAGELPWWATR